MLQISADLLAMSNDAAVLIKNGRLAFANSAATAILGRDCIGKPTKAVLGNELAEIQAGSFIGDFMLGDKRYIVRVRSEEGIKAVFLTASDSPAELVSDAFVFSLRNLLLNIETSMELINSSNYEPGSEMRSRLCVINQQCYRINRILSNLMLIRAAKENLLVFTPCQVNVSALVRSIVEAVSSFTPGPELSFRFEEDICANIDPRLVKCLVMNLISNSLVHAEDCSRIMVNLLKRGGSIILSVDDNGAGIAPEMLHSVFDRYLHGFDVSNMCKGPGFGLAAARAVAACHGGTLLLESRAGIGTAVRVSLGCGSPDTVKLKAYDEGYSVNTRELLVGFADCLDAEYYSEKFSD